MQAILRKIVFDENQTTPYRPLLQYRKYRNMKEHISVACVSIDEYVSEGMVFYLFSLNESIPRNEFEPQFEGMIILRAVDHIPGSSIKGCFCSLLFSNNEIPPVRVISSASISNDMDQRFGVNNWVPYLRLSKTINPHTLMFIHQSVNESSLLMKNCKSAIMFLLNQYLIDCLLQEHKLGQFLIESTPMTSDIELFRNIELIRQPWEVEDRRPARKVFFYGFKQEITGAMKKNEKVTLDTNESSRLLAENISVQSEDKEDMSDRAMFDIVQEYCRISKIKNPSARDLDRLEEILVLSQYDAELCSLINEADHLIAYELELPDVLDRLSGKVNLYARHH